MLVAVAVAKAVAVLVSQTSFRVNYFTFSDERKYFFRLKINTFFHPEDFFG